MRRLVMLVLLVPLLVFGTSNATEARNAPPAAGLIQPDDGLDPGRVAASARDAVVRIRSFISLPDQNMIILVAQGSGVVIDDLGHVVTNNHVLSDGERFEITPADGRQLWGSLVARDTKLDLAVLQVQEPLLSVAQFGDSSRVRIGQEVLALGYAAQPIDTANGRTGAVVTLDSGFATGGIQYNGLIASDVLLFPGDSGGPLLDAQARVIGLNTAIAIHRPGRVDLSYSIPVNQVLDVLDELLPSPAPADSGMAYTVNVAHSCPGPLDTAGA